VECHNVVIVIVGMLSLIMLCVIMLNVVMLNAVMLSVIMLSVILPSVVLPKGCYTYQHVTITKISIEIETNVCTTTFFRATFSCGNFSLLLQFVL
jgi:hypothetical protein